MPKTLNQFISEQEKPFIKVEMHGPTKYKVLQSTHSGFKSGDVLSDSDYDELHQAHQAGDVHLENASKKGSGPGKTNESIVDMADATKQFVRRNITDRKGFKKAKKAVDADFNPDGSMKNPATHDKFKHMDATRRYGDKIYD